MPSIGSPRSWARRAHRSSDSRGRGWLSGRPSTGSDATRSGRHDHALAQQSPHQSDCSSASSPGRRAGVRTLAGQHRLDRVLGGGGQLIVRSSSRSRSSSAAAGDPGPQSGAAAATARLEAERLDGPQLGERAQAAPAGSGRSVPSATAAATASTAAEPAADASARRERHTVARAPAPAPPESPRSTPSAATSASAGSSCARATSCWTR